MSRKVKLRGPARRDLQAHYEYIGKDSLGAADHFLSAFYLTVSDLAFMPDMGSEIVHSNKTLDGLRFIPIRRFDKFLIYYRPTEHDIIVVRVLHSARDVRRILGI